MYQGVFLDRDGVINEVLSERVKFVNKPSDFYFLPGAKEGIRILTEVGYKIFVVTNQGGVGLGFMKHSALENVHQFMVGEIKAAGGKIEEVAACIHKPNEGCICRKPGPKMLGDLAIKYQIDLASSYMVGDRDVDILAGKAAGTKTIFIGSSMNDAYINFPSLLEAAIWLKAQKEGD
ncbi:D-glycero-alpha-D-manno-heptose-1,7-bisphosphate 7-phosphatase [Sutcliffiella halmapala]|uniref:D-glycero-alpha-D-manno-heptose-1,7-bisphosphate 7-phosphatase n=1 Tax=Sutcliffiella halmapala TaxID=79882 RepID=UPI000995AA89|nr:HAD family hydrolase [Sutcliffiella halmapala]